MAKTKAQLALCQFQPGELQQRRLDLHLTLADVAAACGVGSTSTILSWERGGIPRPEAAPKYLRALKLKAAPK